MIKRDDIIWLAGLLEGEGCFRLNDGKYPGIAVGMTDEDVIDRVADMWNVRVSHHKNLWKAQINGAYAIQWMMTLYLLLGKRRREVIAEIIKFWEEYPYSRASNGIRTMAKCHPDRVAVGLDLCHMCYQRQ